MVLDNTKLLTALEIDNLIGDGDLPITKLADGSITGSLIAPTTITSANIVDGTIVSGDIAAGTITSNNIATGTITASNIQSGTITASLMAANSIIAVNITSGAITTEKLASNIIFTNHLNAGIITANEIASGAIVAGKIAAGSITSNEIAAGTIVAVNIAAGTITSDQIAAGTITATEIMSGTITGELISAQTITASNLVSGTITGTQISAGAISANNISSATITGDKIAANTITAANIATLDLTAKDLIADQGTIGTWIIGATTISSGGVNTSKIVLDKANNRISVYDAIGEKVAIGYLGGLSKADGSGNWGVNDYGFWAKDGDRLRIDGDAEYINGDWLIHNDASYLVQTTAGINVVRLGTDAGQKGLFIYDAAGNTVAKYHAGGFSVGSATNGMSYDVGTDRMLVSGTISAGGLTGGTITGTYISGTIIVGSTIKTKDDGQRVEINSTGISFYTENDARQYNSFLYAEGKYGSGKVASLFSDTYQIPFYVEAEQDVADIHLYNRTSTPTGAATIGDLCVVNGELMLCTADGTPGTWTVVGTQS